MSSHTVVEDVVDVTTGGSIGETSLYKLVVGNGIGITAVQTGVIVATDDHGLLILLRQIGHISGRLLQLELTPVTVALFGNAVAVQVGGANQITGIGVQSGADELLTGSNDLKEGDTNVTHALIAPTAVGHLHQIGIQNTNGLGVVSQASVQVTLILIGLVGVFNNSIIIIGHKLLDIITPVTGELLESDNIRLVILHHGDSQRTATAIDGSGILTPVREATIVAIFIRQHVVGHETDVGAGGHGLRIGANILFGLGGLLATLNHHDVINVEVILNQTARAVTTEAHTNRGVGTGVERVGNLSPIGLGVVQSNLSGQSLIVGSSGRGSIDTEQQMNRLSGIGALVPEGNGVVGVSLHSHILLSSKGVVTGRNHSTIRTTVLVGGVDGDSGRATTGSPRVLGAGLEITVDDQRIDSRSLGLNRSLGLVTACRGSGTGQHDVVDVASVETATTATKLQADGGLITGVEGLGDLLPHAVNSTGITGLGRGLSTIVSSIDNGVSTTIAIHDVHTHGLGSVGHVAVPEGDGVLRVGGNSNLLHIGSIAVTSKVIIAVQRLRTAMSQSSGQLTTAHLPSGHIAALKVAVGNVNIDIRRKHAQG